ncbi:MAG: hypothetical protein ACYS17_14890, partial [Planctomycetota bacterium]|jgi:hypothetical protein
LGLLLVGPFLVTILGRSRWVNECQHRLEVGNDDQVWEQFHQQRLWPMDPKHMDKVGILVCIILFSIYAGTETLKYTSLF